MQPQLWKLLKRPLQLLQVRAISAVAITLGGASFTTVDLAVADGPTPALLEALHSIRAADLEDRISVLADDSFEGREAGTRGGRAAAGYITSFLEKEGVSPAGEGGSYLQAFGANYRNILGLIEGSDPQLSREIIVVGAHYDHVGYGSYSNSYGPTGYIHNGADDNASGTSGIMEVIQAVKAMPVAPRRSILFAFWDGEEKGLLGSKHWVGSPTVDWNRVKLMLNNDMIGRLRDDRLIVYGTRTSYGLRRLVSQQNELTQLRLDFSWEIQANSDHHPFYARSIPILMMHTDLHDEYHRPSDDAHLINYEGTARVSQLIFSTVWAAANESQSFRFRSAARRESPTFGFQLRSRPEAKPGRLGVSWKGDDAKAEGLTLSSIVPGGAAARAGLKPGDTILKLNAEPVESDEWFRRRILGAATDVTFEVRRGSPPLENQPALEQVVVSLDGQPVRVGISWKTDSADPGVLLISNVVPGSAAAVAGVRIGDRIYGTPERSFQDNSEFNEVVAQHEQGPLGVLLERNGRIRRIELDLPPQ